VPDAPGLELIAQQLNERRGGTVVETSFEHDSATLVVEPEAILEALAWLRDTPGQEYRFLSSLHAADYLPAQPRFGVHYELLCMARVERIHVKAMLPDPAPSRQNGSSASPARASQAAAPGREAEEAAVDGEAALPEIDSCVELFPTADFHEREAYDFFGIVFRNHPDLRRILMPDDYVGWPQRRDYPVGGEPVLFTHNEVEMPRWYE
jgi:NADH-quinone oxidoreductase subunit C